MKTQTTKRPAGKAAKTEVAVTAKLFRNGRSQAVRLPKEFRFEGDHVRIRKVKHGVLLEAVEGPKPFDIDGYFARLDDYNAKYGPFMPDGRMQPEMQERDWFD